MSDDPRDHGVKLETKMEKSVGSIDQPSTRTVEGNGAALRKQGNEVIVAGGASAEVPSYYGASGKSTTNPPFSKSSGLQELPQKFTPGSGTPPSRLND